MTANLPQDLIPLPTMPYDSRPDSLPLDIEECRTALWRVRGNITEAARILKVPSLRLRNFINRSPYLSAEQKEAQEILKDLAEDVVYDALTDEDDKGRQDAMARFVLQGIGKDRGWGSGGTKVQVNNSQGGTVIVGWQDGTVFQPEQGKVIDHD